MQRPIHTTSVLLEEIKTLRAERDRWQAKALAYEARGDLGIGYHFGLSRSLAHFFALLMQYDVVTRELALREMYGNREHLPSARIFQTLASKLRDRFAVRGHEDIAHAIKGRRNFGWWLEPHIKARVMAAYVKAVGK